MAVALEDFPTWLSRKLQELNTDESIFGSYITGIVDSDDSDEEKLEALQGIVSEIIENEEEINRVCNEILERWQNQKVAEKPVLSTSQVDVDDKLVKLLESQSLATTKTKKYTAEEKKIREAILMQYSQMTDDENEDEENQASGDTKEKNDLEKNTNFQSVVQAEKVKREQAKIDSQKKKDKDKEDREKQKQLREEKKEKRKTVKGERKR